MSAEDHVVHPVFIKDASDPVGEDVIVEIGTDYHLITGGNVG